MLRFIIFRHWASLLFENHSFRNFQQAKTPSMEQENHIVWIDCEMSGLDVKRDKILEIACLITDKNLNITSEGPCLALHQTDEVLGNMDEWCQEHHTNSGLVEMCKNSVIDVEKAEKILLEFLHKHVPRGKCPLAGNSVYMDRIFLKECMPNLEHYFHYRNIDVSTVKELCKRWSPSVFEGAPKKKLVHRSLEDIKESIRELSRSLAEPKYDLFNSIGQWK